MAKKISTEELLERMKEQTNTIDLDFIGQVCRKHNVRISVEWYADGGVELYCCPELTETTTGTNCSWK